MMTWPADNKTALVAHIHVDKLDDAWVNRISGVDFLQLSTGSLASYWKTVLFQVTDIQKKTVPPKALSL